MGGTHNENITVDELLEGSFDIEDRTYHSDEEWYKKMEEHRIKLCAFGSTVYSVFRELVELRIFGNTRSKTQRFCKNSFI